MVRPGGIPSIDQNQDQNVIVLRAPAIVEGDIIIYNLILILWLFETRFERFYYLPLVAAHTPPVLSYTYINKNYIIL